MKILEQYYDVEEFDINDVLDSEEDNEAFKKAIYFDLEHYVYKKPICIGVFGCCYYDSELNKLVSTQYMIENKNEVHTFTGINYVDFYKELVESENCEIDFVFANDPKVIYNYVDEALACDIHTRFETKRLLNCLGLDDILNESINGSGFNSKYG